MSLRNDCVSCIVVYFIPSKEKKKKDLSKRKKIHLSFVASHFTERHFFPLIGDSRQEDGVFFLSVILPALGSFVKASTIHFTFTCIDLCCHKSVLQVVVSLSAPRARPRLEVIKLAYTNITFQRNQSVYILDYLRCHNPLSLRVLAYNISQFFYFLGS